MKVKELSDEEILIKLRNNADLLKELDKRHKGSLLVDLEIYKVLDIVGEERIKKWLKDIKE
jgi:SpoVK/Ycf46/Vps4 family AAA+-type ATPase